jgi:transcriptional regulator with XRE-family HTH domain
MNTLGTRLRDARVAAKMTQEQLARAANVTVMTVSNIERGAIENPKRNTLVALAAALGVSIDSLAAAEDPPDVVTPSAA